MSACAGLIDDAKRYLGYGRQPNDDVDPQTAAKLLKAVTDLESINSYKFVHKVFDVTVCDELVSIKNSNLTFHSRSLSKHLKDCTAAVFFAATLGIEVDRLIASLSVSDMENAIIYDAVAGAYIEYRCDQSQQSILLESSLNKTGFTSRFSPGYGDLELEQHHTILSLLDAPKKIGLTATFSHMLIPMKSVVAIWGMPGVHAKLPRYSCTACDFKDSCTYKK